jgi:membrane-bound lytic murein transglycosylase F
MICFVITACAPGDRGRVAHYEALGELRVATRQDAISYLADGAESASGFEHDLIQALAHRLGVPVRFVLFPDAMQALGALMRGEVHIAAAGLARNDRLPVTWSPALRELDYVLAGQVGSATIDHEKDLVGRTISARRGSFQAQMITEIRQRRSGIEVHFPTGQKDQRLLAQLAAGKLDLVATDRAHFALAAQVHPEIEVKFDLPRKSAIAWALPRESSGDLAQQVARFIADANASDLLARIADRYFMHAHRVTRADTLKFLERIALRLPALRPHFHDAQAETGIDWRYLAALAYQESHWDPAARSRTGVRGVMMLTSETADRLGVANRLDARDSILGGARYLAMLRDSLPDTIAEPDRTWIATAAYNLGMGHMNGARAIARSMARDDTSWWDMKAVLPLLKRPEYAARLKSGPARGGEAVIMTENIRNYYGILTRIEPPYDTLRRETAIRLRPISSQAR